MLKKKLNLVLVPLVAALATVAPMAHAAAGDIDVTPITNAGVQVGLVGVAVFAVIVGAKVFKWIRRAL